MRLDREAYNKCFRPVFHFYKPSETRGFRRGIEFVVASTIAWEADAEGVLPPTELEYLAEISRLTLRTFRRYLGVLIDSGWLLEYYVDGQTRYRIDPNWLRDLPYLEPDNR
jgi:hypothetical protein